MLDLYGFLLQVRDFGAWLVSLLGDANTKPIEWATLLLQFLSFVAAMTAAAFGGWAALAAIRLVRVEQSALEPVLVVASVEPHRGDAIAWRIENVGDGVAIETQAIMELHGDDQMRVARFDLGNLERGHPRVVSVFVGGDASAHAIGTEAISVLVGWVAGAGVRLDDEVVGGIPSLRFSAAGKALPTTADIRLVASFQCRSRFGVLPAIQREWLGTVRLEDDGFPEPSTAVALQPWNDVTYESLRESLVRALI